MTDALVLIGRETAGSAAVLETHARRLRDRGVADSVHTVQYDSNPGRSLREAVADLDAAQMYVVPTALDRSRLDASRIREAADRASIHVCEPVGRSPAVTDVLVERARERADVPSETTVILAGLGRGCDDGTAPAAAYHAERMRESTTFDQVLTCYLVQEPSPECVGLDAVNDEAVVVPLFLADCEATDDRLPDVVDADGLTVAHADPLGTHTRVTDGVAGEVARMRVIAEAADAGAVTADDSPTIAADGNGPMDDRHD